MTSWSQNNYSTHQIVLKFEGNAKISTRQFKDFVKSLNFVPTNSSDLNNKLSDYVMLWFVSCVAMFETDSDGNGDSGEEEESGCGYVEEEDSDSLGFFQPPDDSSSDSGDEVSLKKKHYFVNSTVYV